jgi:hypothetical protein
MSYLDYARVVWKSRWLVLLIIILSLAVGVAVGYLQPRVYTATAIALPPKESAAQSLSMSLGALLTGGGAGGAGGQGGGGGVTSISLGGGGTGGATSMDLIIAILKSRTMKESVLAEVKKNLGRPLRYKEIEDILPDIKNRVAIGVTVNARDPRTAAIVANTYFDQLNQNLDRQADRAAKRMEDAYAAQLQRSAEEVDRAEAAVIKFQTENRFLVSTMETPTRNTVEAGATLRGQIMALELQREISRMKMTEQHPQMRELEAQIAGLKRMYSKNLFGGAMDLPTESGIKGDRREFFVAAEKMTPVQFAFLKVFRHLKIQEAFYTAALQGLQQIKYGDASSRTYLDMLDPAEVSEQPIKPNMNLIIGASVAIGLIVGVALALIIEFLRLAGFTLGRRRLRGKRRAVVADGNGHGADGVTTTDPALPGRQPARL